MEQYEPRTGWEAVVHLAVPRWGVRAAGRSGSIFVVGGHVGELEVGTTDCRGLRVALGTCDRGLEDGCAWVGL